MSQTETKLIRKTKTQPLDLKDLKTVKWVSGVEVVSKTYDFSKQKYDTARRMPILNWIIASIEMFFISIFLFIHSLPWPNWMLEILYKIDRIIVQILEGVSNKVEWWWDVLVIRLMWFRDSVEALIDTFLSLIIFIAYKVIEFWMRIFYFWLSVVKFIFSPLIWAVKAILPPPAEKPEPKEKSEKKKPTSPSSPPPVNDHLYTEGTHAQNGTKESEKEETNHLSGTTSECDSDISAVSESWSIGHTDKHGKSYNRLEMKATAEGKLRAAMYKRVKTQLTLMRKNSISFSRGMTAYAKEHLLPRVEPTLTAMMKWLRNLAEKYGFADVLDQLMNRIENHYILSALLSFWLYIILIPIKISKQLLTKGKKKSRRTRSMRSESLRRRTAGVAGVTSPGLEPLGLNQSKEPVVVEEPEFVNLETDQNNTEDESVSEDVVDKGDDDALRDSALASSVDDLYHMSDSNDGSNSLKDQIIQEEDDKEEEIKAKNFSKENGILKSVDKSNQTKLEDREYNSDKEINQDITTGNNETNKDKKGESKKEAKKDVQNDVGPINDHSSTPNNIKVSQLAVPQVDNEKPQSPQTRKKSLKETKSNAEDGTATVKSPKRKISFSLT